MSIIAEGVARGFDTFDRIIKEGDFDRILLRPLGTFFQIATREVQLMRLGRFLQGFIVLMWSCQQLHISLISFEGAAILFAIIGTTGLLFLVISSKFWQFGVRHYHSTGH
jgi:ABC-2 type transport system permease protein